MLLCSAAGKTNQFWESLSTRLSSVALMFQILQFAVKMSVNLAASQTRRLSVSASDNQRTEHAQLIDLKWRIQVTLLHKRQLSAPLGWFLFADVRPHSRSGPSDLIRTGKYLETQSAWKSPSEPRSVGTERKWRSQRGEAIILPASGSFNLHAYRKSLIGGSRLSAQTTRTLTWARPLRNAALPLIMFGSSALFPHLWALGSTSLPSPTWLAAGVTGDFIKPHQGRVAQRRRQECAEASMGYIIFSLGRRRRHSFYFVLHQKTAVECNVRRGARHCSLSHSPHARQQQWQKQNRPAESFRNVFKTGWRGRIFHNVANLTKKTPSGGVT